MTAGKYMFALFDGLKIRIVMVALLLAGCDFSYIIEMASEHEQIPGPSFLVKHPDNDEVRYVGVSVVEIPQSEAGAVWHVAHGLSTEALITYGSSPEGLRLVEGLAKLEVGQTYLLTVYAADPKRGPTDGVLRFTVDAAGFVVEAHN